MLKLYRNVLAAGVVALGLAACGDNVTTTNPPPVTPVVHNVAVVPTSVTANVGQAGIVFVASVFADSGISSAVTWTSTNNTVATVNVSTGAVVAVAPGQATIVATSTGDPTKTGAGSITVVAPPANITTFTVTPQNAAIAVGGTVQVNPSVTQPAGAVAATYTYATSSAATATVSATGQITGISTGTAIVTATATSGTQTLTATVGVTVGSGPPGLVSFSVSPSAMTLFATQTQQATATVVSPGFTYPVTWTSLAPTVATVSGTGLVTAVAQGTAVITATIGTSPNTLSQSIVVTVAQGVSISINSITAAATAGTVPGCAGIVGNPVILTNVNCQIDVNMNLNAGVQPLDSLVVRLKQPSGFKTLAKQVYGNTIPSSGIVTLSINTANFVKVPTTATTINGVAYPAGTVAVDLFNGPSNLLTQVYPHIASGGTVTNCQVGATDATCAIVNSIVLNNTDGWAADIQKCSGGTGTIAATPPICAAAAPSSGLSGATTGTNTSTGGFANDVSGNLGNAGLTYWGGPTGSGQTTAEIYAVIYNDNPSFPSGSSLNRCNNTLGNNTGCINSVTWSIGTPIANLAGGNNAASLPNTVVTEPVANPAIVGTPALWCAPGAAQTTLPFRKTFGTLTGATSSCNNYENITPVRDNILITTSIDGVNNPFTNVGMLTGVGGAAGTTNTVLIPNTVVPGSTPDSARYDYKAPASITSPTILGAEGQNWVNRNWLFKPAGGLVTDNGVGPAAATWASFCSNTGAANSICQQGGSGTFTTLLTSGGDQVNLVETNTKTVDAFSIVALGTDLLGNGSASGVASTFGVDWTAPIIRISVAGAPSNEGAGVYLGGGAGGISTVAVLDSTVYNAIEGEYGALVATPGARTQFLSAALGTGDSLRIESIDSRSGLRRAIGTTMYFSQGGAAGTNVTLPGGYNCVLCFLPNTVDNWTPSPALHVLASGVQNGPGYYTTTEYVVDNAGNVSGCPITGTISGSFCTASLANAGANTNPAMLTIAGQNANLFARRTLALDPAQPQVTGVSPNNSYTGNQPANWTLGAQDDLEVIDTRFRIQYPNLTTGDINNTVPPTGGLVWSYALSNTFMPSGFSAGPASNAFAPATAAAGVNFGFFSPLGFRFDGLPVTASSFGGAPNLGIVNPLLKTVSLDMFTLNVQETCTNVAPPGNGFASGEVVATACNGGMAVGDPIPFTGAGSIPLAKPNNLGVQVRDVFGSWVFNDNPGSATTGVAAEFISPVLSATVAAPGGYSVTYSTPILGATTSCAEGGQTQPAGSASCVATGINFRADINLSVSQVALGTPGLKVYRASETLSNTLPLFTRVELYGRNALGQWVFVSRIVVPNPVLTGAGCPSSSGSVVAGTVVGCDNGNERYWFYSFTAPAGFTAFRAIGVNAAGFGLASTIN
jgi:uncharacterized protein YjdB